MARLWSCGYELQSSTVGVEYSSGGTQGTINTTTKRSGAASYRCNPAAASMWHGQVAKAAASSTQLWARVAINVATRPSSETEFAGLWNAGAATRQLWVGIDNTGVIRLHDSAGTTKVTSSAQATGVDLVIEFTSTVHATTPSMELRINGVSVGTASTGVVGNYDALYLGTPNGAGTYDIYFDDVAINDSSGSAQTSWPGLGKIIMLRPDGDGDNHALLKQGGGAGSSTNWQDVDETTPDDATTYLKRTATGAQIDDYTMGASGLASGDTVVLVSVGGRVGAISTTATGRSWIYRIKKAAAGTVSASAAFACNVNGWTTHTVTVPKNYPLTAYTDPDGAAWTNTTIDSMQAGIREGASSANEIRVSALWALVEYILATAVTVTGDVTSTAAIARTEARSVTSAAALSTTNTRSVTSVAAVSRIEARSVTSAAAISRTEGRSVTTAAAILVGARGRWRLDEASGDAIEFGAGTNDGTVTIVGGNRQGSVLHGINFVNDDLVSIPDVAGSTQNPFDAGGTIYALTTIRGPGDGPFGSVLFGKSGPWDVVSDNWDAGSGTMGLKLTYFTSLGYGQWWTSSRVLSVGVRYAVALAYNADSASNDPTILLKNLDTGSVSILTVGAGLTEGNAPTGVRNTDAGSPFTIGNGADQARTWDGEIADVRISPTILSQAEFEALNVQVARDVTSSAALATTNARLVTSAAALSDTVTRDVSSSSAVSRTETKSVTSAAAVSDTLTRDVTSTITLTRTPTRDITTQATLTRTLTRDVTSTAALAAPAGRSVPSVAAISAEVSRSVTSGASISQTAAISVTSAAALSVAVTTSRDVTTAAALSAPAGRSVTTGAALARTEGASVSSGAAVSRTEVASVTSSAAVSVSVGVTRDVTSEASLAVTAARNVTSAAALAITVARDVTSEAAVSVAGAVSADVTTAAAIAATVGRSVTSSAALSRTEARSVTSSAALAQAEQADVTSTTTLSRTGVAEITSSAAIEAGAAASVTTSAAISMVAIRSVTSLAALARAELRNVTTSAAIAPSGVAGEQDVTTTAVIILTPSRDVTTVAALYVHSPIVEGSSSGRTPEGVSSSGIGTEGALAGRHTEGVTSVTGTISAG